MDILEKITKHKKEEVKIRKQKTAIKKLEQSQFFSRSVYSVTEFIKNKSGIIAEFKRQSPSKGVIHLNPNLKKITKGYTEAGVSAISVLTDHYFFGGTDNDLIETRQFNSIPLLRKDFIIDEYQIIESKAIGADLILLIAACLTPKEVQKFARLAQSLGLEVLLEVHNEFELEKSLCDELNLIGVNNRNLKTFEVNLNHSYELVEKIPNQFLKISESGISNPKTIKSLQKVGFDGFLIGENFMKTTYPEQSCLQFIQELSK
ncbi:MAG: hypothetical protein RI943_1022 [Bacteroidota bacterium]|jgi:indole-3-glycerol phosphate synthase